jgi:hypothetical protein
MEELNKEQEAPKKKKASKKKPVKVELKDKLIEMAAFIEKSVKEERGKQLNTSSCSRLNKIKMDLNMIIRTL